METVQLTLIAMVIAEEAQLKMSAGYAKVMVRYVL
jgi:hypothetical protein